MTFPAVAGADITAALINHMYGISDTTTHTVTAASLTNLSSVYTIPAGDAAATASVTYRLTAFGYGTWGSTQQTLAWAIALAGTVVGTTPTIQNTQFSASALFRWKAAVLLIPATLGSSATWWANLEGLVTETANNIVIGTAADNSVAFADGNSSAVTQDSTIANTLAIQAGWGSATGSPTITCQGTTFERVG